MGCGLRFGIDDQLLVELLAGAQTLAAEFDGAMGMGVVVEGEATETPLLFCQIPDPDGLPHTE